MEVFCRWCCSTPRADKPNKNLPDINPALETLRVCPDCAPRSFCASRPSPRVSDPSPHKLITWLNVQPRVTFTCCSPFPKAPFAPLPSRALEAVASLRYSMVFPGKVRQSWYPLCGWIWDGSNVVASEGSIRKMWVRFANQWLGSHRYKSHASVLTS